MIAQDPTNYKGGTVMRIFSFLFLFILLASSVNAREIADVNVPEKITFEDGVILHLNGAGVRSKLFFKIYIAELYMQHPTSDTVKLISDEGRKRMIMHFIYEELGKEKLVEAWNEGFHANTDQKQLALLEVRIAQFNAMFDSVKKGEEIVLDYIPEKGTQVSIRNQVKGVVPGKDFNDALLSIWLGKEPVNPELRKELLDYTGAQ
jgi:hypothetical protein